MAKKEFYSRGKLLLTGEYAVVHGAKAIALPTKYGQSLIVSTGRGSDIRWKSLNDQGEEWFSAKISLFDFSPIKTSDEKVGARLSDILQSAVRLNSEFLSTWKGIRAETKLEFPLQWGLGSSATLIANIAAWADVDPFELYKVTFGGSGYDVACSLSDSPILFQLGENNVPELSKIHIPEEILNRMTFIYSGRKENSRKALDYINDHEISLDMVKSISNISENLLNGSKLKDWISSLKEHNAIISEYLNQAPFEPELEDFEGVIKPLGAWGGDFMLALSPQSEEEVHAYFNGKGYKEILPASELIFEQELVAD